MIDFDVAKFEQSHREQLQAMCAVPPELEGQHDEFAYFPVDVVYTTGSGLPSFLVRQASQENLLLTISEDSDVIFTQWNLALLLHKFVAVHEQKWLNKLTQSTLPILQHSLTNGTSIYPITGLNSLYLTLLAYNRGITDNIWKVVHTANDDTAYLSSYIHRLSSEPMGRNLRQCPHPFMFVDADERYQQHIYAGVNITPCDKNYRNFCERLPFKLFGIQYTPASWSSLLINKFSHFEAFDMAIKVAAKHPDLFSALIICSVGFPTSMLYEHTNYCSLLDISKYEICEALVLMPPLVDYCTTIMTDETQINNGISYYLDQHNHDMA